MNWGKGVVWVLGWWVLAYAGMTEGGAGMTGMGRRSDGRWGAGMTGVGHWCRVAGVKHVADSLSAAQRACRAAAALARSGGGGVNRS